MDKWTRLIRNLQNRTHEHIRYGEGGFCYRFLLCSVNRGGTPNNKKDFNYFVENKAIIIGVGYDMINIKSVDKLGKHRRIDFESVEAISVIVSMLNEIETNTSEGILEYDKSNLYLFLKKYIFSFINKLYYIL